MAVAVANSNIKWGFSTVQVTSFSVTFTNNVTAANTILVGGGTDGGNAGSTNARFTSSRSDVFRWDAGSDTDGSLRVNICAVSSAVGGSTQITFLPISSDWASVAAVELSAVSSAAKFGSSEDANNIANPSAGAIAGVPAGGIVFGYCVRNAGGAITPNNGFTEIGNDSSYAGPGGASSYLLTASSGSYTASWTVGAAAWWAAAVAYNSTEAAPAGAPLRGFYTGDLSGVGSPGRFFKDRLQRVVESIDFYKAEPA